MPSKKKKYNARFPPARIKKIMQTDEEVGKVAAAVPVIISRALELFVESLLTKAVQITSAKNAKTLSPAHLKQCILAESRFDFLKDLVLAIPDVQADGEEASVIPVTPTSSNAPQAPTFRQMEPSSSAPSRGRVTGRPRGRPRKVAGPPATAVKNEPRSWENRQSDGDETDSDSEESYDDDEETDTDSAPKAAPAAKNGQNAVSQKATQFNAVQPNFYQEISASNNTPFEIKISLPSAGAAPDVKVDDQKTVAAEDDDYDT